MLNQLGGSRRCTFQRGGSWPEGSRRRNWGSLLVQGSLCMAHERDTSLSPRSIWGCFAIPGARSGSLVRDVQVALPWFSRTTADPRIGWSLSTPSFGPIFPVIGTLAGLVEEGASGAAGGVSGKFISGPPALKLTTCTLRRPFLPAEAHLSVAHEAQTQHRRD